MKKKEGIFKQHPKLRKSFRRLLPAIKIAPFLIIIPIVFKAFLGKTNNLKEFRLLCTTIHKGDLLENLQERSRELGFSFEQDPETIGQETENFLIRPHANWPERYSCRFQARSGRIVLIER